MSDQIGPSPVEERGLAEWLEANAPQPPRVLSAENITARLSTARPGRRWLSAFAAATVAVVIIVAVAVAATHLYSHSAPATGPTNSAPPSPAPPSPAPKRTGPPHVLPVRPWHARQLGSLPLLAGSTTVLDGQLYGEAERGRRSATLYRIDPSTGAPLAHADHVSGGLGGLGPVAAGGLLWVSTATSTAVLGLDPVTLAVRATVRVPVRTGIAPQGADTVVVSDDHRVSFIRARTVTHQLTIRHQIQSIAMSADGTRLFVATELGSIPGPGQIETLDPRTGSPLAAPVRGLEMVFGLHATSGGLWYTSDGGMQATIAFQPYQGHKALDAESGVGHSGGGTLTLPTLSDGVAWLGSTLDLGCADPDTGTLRAQVPVYSQRGIAGAEISGLVALHGKVYAVYNGLNGGPANALIVMRPPAKCFGN